MKTKSGAKKRFKITGSGKVKYKRANLRHILTKKSSKRKRHLGKHGILTHADEGRIAALIPYEA